MSNVDALISEIKENITKNGKQAITGPVLQSVLVDMVNGLQTDGLGFLGIIEPGDPAPSTEKNGYYLSFSVNNEKYPEAKKWEYTEDGDVKIRKYFNGAELNRYCLFLWTLQDGKWKFKRIKYEYHTRQDAIVIGRGLPIHYNKENDTYTLCLSDDGKMTRYAVCGFSPFRVPDDGTDFNGRGYRAIGQRGGEKGVKSHGYELYYFPPEDNGKEFTKYSDVPNYINKKKIGLVEDLEIQPQLSSPNYKAVWLTDGKTGYWGIRWEPQVMTHPVFYKRVARNLNYFGETSKWESRKNTQKNWWIKWLMMANPLQKKGIYLYHNGIIRASKRKDERVGRNVKRSGVSDNCIIVSNDAGIMRTIE